jgi:tryptophan synthase alpha chain
MGLERIRDLFARTRSENRAAFLPFLTAGLPDPASSPSLFRALAEGGADGFEVGIPYADPLMDGPVIQAGSEAALAAGADLDTCLAVVGEVSATTGLPNLVMTYANPVFRRGVDRFFASIAERGVDGVIIPDLPLEESGPVRDAAGRHGLGVVLFVAPTSGRDRIEAVAATEPAFIYGIADLGVTGERSTVSEHVESLASLVRSITDVPLVLGVGISTPEQAAVAARVADGFIVGSALVHRVLDAGDPAQAAEWLRAAARELSAAARRG